MTYIYSAKDASEAFEAVNHSAEARELMKKYCVGNYVDVNIVIHTFVSLYTFKIPVHA